MLDYLLGGGCLLLASLSAWAWGRGRATPAVLLLMGAALLLRLLMANLDPFLHDWDERFHAVVARNMLLHPFRPILQPHPLLPYDYHAWCCNYIWLHKQPLFLWLMALSMKVFGVGTLAMRLPSALLGALLVWPVYRLGVLALGNALAGYLGAVLVTFAYYQLELISGAIGMDHNDLAFLVFVTGSIWAYYEYRANSRPVGWLVLVGVLAGAAVLCKWLTGLLVYGGWGLDALLHLRQRRLLPELAKGLASLAVAVAVALPWQLYTAWRFPLESTHERAFNGRHFTEVIEGQNHTSDYYFQLLPDHYSPWLLALMALGLGLGLRRRTARRIVPLLGMIAAIYLLFTLAATKMPSYTYMVSALLLLLAGLGLAETYRYLRRWQPASPRLATALTGFALLGIAVADLQPWCIVGYHRYEQTYGMVGEKLRWRPRANNAAIYRQLPQALPPGYTILNVPYGDELETMFYTGHQVYAGIPNEDQIKQMRHQGARFALFPAQPGQYMPPYLAQPDVLQLWGVLEQH
jgi:4-amino-4-deoxy-L-arabinose transferase